MKYLFLFLIIFSPILEAANIEVEPQVMFFDFTEFDVNGKKLVNENGHIKGIGARFSYQLFSPLVFGMDGRKFSGDVDYQGRTQIGANHSTTTHQSITDIGFYINYSIRKDMSLGIHMSRFDWQRNIQPTKNVSGLTEEYQWYQAKLVGKYQLPLKFNQLITFVAGFNVILSPKMTIFIPNYGIAPINLSLGEEQGYYAEIGYRKRLHQNIELSSTLKIDQFSFGKSGEKKVARNDRLYSIHQPRSESQYVIAAVAVKYYF